MSTQLFSVTEDARIIGALAAPPLSAGITYYSIHSGNEDGLFDIHLMTGQITVANERVLDYETETSHGLTVVAFTLVSDSVGEALSAESAIIDVTISVTDVAEAPIMDAVSYDFSIAEDTLGGATVGTVSATDGDGDALIYSITGGNEAGLFAINSETGEITVASGKTFDYESAIPKPVGNEFRVNSHTEGWQHSPSVAALDNGGFVVTWESWYQDGSGAGVYAQLYDGNGNTVGNEFLVNSQVSNWQRKPFVTTLSNGGFVVTWESYGQDGSGNGVYAKLYDGNGNAVSGEIQVNNHTLSSQDWPTVAALNDGGFVVTWESYGQDGSDNGIYARRYDDIGNAVGDEFQVNTHTPSLQGWPFIVALRDGGFVVTWHSSDQDGSGYGVYGQLYDSNGDAVGSEFRVNSYTDFSQKDPFVAALSGGGFVVTWESSGQDGSDNGVYAQIYDGNGTAVGGEFRVNSYTTSKQGDPSVAALSDGGFLVVWDSYGQDGSLRSVYAQRYDSNGNTVGGEFRVNSHTESGQDNSSVIALGDGGFVVTWTSWEQDGSGYGIYAQVYESAPASHTLTVTAQDSLTGGLSDSATVTVTVTDVAEAPVMDAASYDFNIAEDALGGATVGAVRATDGDGDILIYSITGGNDAGLFEINAAAAGEITVTSGRELDHESASSHVLTVTVRDSLTGGLSVSAPVTVTVTDVNEAPVMDAASYDLSIAEDASSGATVVTVSAADEDGDTLIYGIIGGNDAGLFTINAATGEITVTSGRELDYESASSHVLTVTVRDSATGGLSDSVTVTVMVTDVAEAPMMNAASYDFSIAEGTSGGATVGTVSATDEDGDTLIYSITRGNEDGLFEIDSATGDITIARGQSLDYESGEAIGDEFRANSHTANNQKSPSVAALSGGGFVMMWESYSQDGSGEGIYAQLYDDNGNAVGGEFLVNSHTTSWQESPLVAALSDGGFVAAWESSGQDGSGKGVYAQIYNGDGSTVGGEFRVNSETAGDQEGISVAALNGGGFVMAWESSVQDGNGKGIYAQRYDSLGNTAGSQFRVSGETTSWQDNPSVAALNGGGFVVAWESESEGENGEDVYAQIYDGNGDAVGGEFRVNSETLNHQDRVSATGLSGGGFVVVWESTFQDGSEDGIYAQIYNGDGSTVGGEFRVNSYTTFSQRKPSVTALGDGGFVVAWQSEGQDGEGDGIYAQRYDSVGDTIGGELRVNSYTTHWQEEPSVAALGEVGFIVAWQSYNQDGSHWGVYGQIYGGGATSHTLTVTAQDSVAGGLSDSATVTVAVTDVAEAPMMDVAAYGFSIAEDALSGDTVGAVSAIDDDGGVVTYSITGGNAAGLFAIDGATGEITIASGQALDYETASSHTLTVMAQDSNGLNGGATVTVMVTDVAEAPVMGETAYSFSIAENALSGDAVGMISATDGDGDTLIYSITGGNVAGLFAINEGTGEITVASGKTLDYESASSHALTVTVRDGIISGLSDSATVTVAVTDVAEAPVMGEAAYSFSIAENALSGITVGTVSATDGDRDTLTYSITGGSGAGLFAIDSVDGKITFVGSQGLDYESSLLSYTLTVMAQDSSVDALSASTQVTVTVMDVNEAPVASGDLAFRVNEDNRYTLTVADITVMDEDAGDGAAALTWQIATVPTNGHIALVGAPTVAIGSFTQAQLEAGEVIYAHDGSETIMDSFVAQAKDTGGLETVAQTVDISITPVDDPPAEITLALVSVVSTDEGILTDRVKVADIAVTDADGGGANSALELTGDDAALFEIDVTQNELYLRRGIELDFETNPILDVTVRAVSDIGVSDHLRIEVTDTDERPMVNGDMEFIIGVGRDYQLTVEDLSAEDANVGSSAGAAIRWLVRDAPDSGKLVLSSNPEMQITSFTQAQLEAGSVVYVHGGGRDKEDSFIVRAEYIGIAPQPADAVTVDIEVIQDADFGPMSYSGTNPWMSALLGDRKWQTDTGGASVIMIEYAFQSGFTTYERISGFGRDWTEQEQAALRTAMEMWESVANIDFVEVEGSDNPEIEYWKFPNAVLDREEESTHTLPALDLSDPLRVGFNYEANGWSSDGLMVGGAGFRAMVHELGHALGLTPPHEEGVFPGVSDGNGDELGDYGLNQGIYTVMSDNRGRKTDGVDSGISGSPMALDIAAIQELYGVNTEFQIGDDTYMLPEGYWLSIWDAGGDDDTISAEGAEQNSHIDLRAADLEGEGGGGYVSYLDGTPGGFTIANTVVIENAVGGSGDDVIIGNGSDNTLTGGEGADRFVFYDNFGSDTITDFDADIDTIEFSGVGEATTRAEFIAALRSEGGDLVYDFGADGVNVLRLSGVAQSELEEALRKAGGELLVNSHMDDEQGLPSVAGLEDGGFVVLWESEDQDEDEKGIYGQRYDSNWEAVGGEFRANTHENNNQEGVSVAGLDDGGFVVLWESEDQDEDEKGIYGQRYDSNGRAVGDEFIVNTHEDENQEGVSVAAGLSGGGFVAAWQSMDQDGDGEGIYARRYDSAGNGGSEFQVNVKMEGDQEGVSVAGLSDGGFIVAWQSEDQDGDGEGIYARRYDSAGNEGDEFQVNVETEGDQEGVSVAGLSDGGFVVAWQSEGQDGDGDGIYARRYDSAGVAVGDEFRVNSERANDKSEAFVAALDNGGFVIAWQSEDQDGDGDGIYGQRYDGAGDAIGGEFLINSETAEDQNMVSVAALGDGGFVTAWQSDEQDGDDEGIYAQIYSGSGAADDWFII